jgi:carbon monoxide dehydrogenase subunit G
MSRTFFCAAVLLVAGTAPSLALEVTRTVDIAAPPAKVWDAVNGFCSIAAWHPAVDRCALGYQDSAATRTLTLKGGGTILERQLQRNDAAMNYSYAIVDGPLPVANYKSTISVTAHGNGAQVVWTGDFDAKGADDAKATSTIQGIYDAGLGGLAAKFR